jgi:electron transfer flavoprotein alpha subunit
MAILLVAEHDNASLSDQTAKALSAALKIGSDVDVLVAGKGAKAPPTRRKAEGRAQGAAGRGRRTRQRLAEPTGGARSSRWPAATTRSSPPPPPSGKNVLPRVAALLDVMQVSEIIEVVSADTFKRPIYAGNAIQTVQSTDKKVITVRTASFQAAAEGGSARSRRSRRRPIRACRPLSRTCCRRAIVRN